MIMLPTCLEDIVDYRLKLKKGIDLAFYVPCIAHSLNLVGDCSAKECLEAINFFSILQKLYTFFTASTHRWDVLLRNSKKSSKTLKSLSSTR